MPQFTSPRPATPMQLRKPRNPFVAPTRNRTAGLHQSPHARQTAQRELAQTLRELYRPPQD